MATESPAPARAFWSGTITFGLVSIPVDLYAAVRTQRVSLRMLGPDGHPLARRYFCSADGEALDWDDLVRGYELDDGSYVVVSDEELEALEPQKSRDIDLRRFVDRSEIDLMLLERTYVLAPAGQSTKAYHLLAETMERTGRVGIATFVMRGREYLAAIMAEGGLLRASTMRFVDEIRTPENVGLLEVESVPAKDRRDMEKALRALERDELDPSQLVDADGARLLALAEKKHAAGQDVVEVPQELMEPSDEEENVVDLMSLIKARLDAAGGSGETARSRVGTSGKHRREELADRSKKELYERAKDLDIPGRSNMSKEELIEALRSAS